MGSRYLQPLHPPQQQQRAPYHIQLQKFDINKIKSTTATKSYNVLIMGTRDAGKTVLANELLYNNAPNCCQGAIMAPDIQYRTDYSAIVRNKDNEGFILTDENYLPEIVNCVIKSCSNTPLHKFVVFDHVMYNLELGQGATIKRQLPILLKHPKINTIVITYTPMFYSKIINYDYVFVMRNPIMDNRRKIYQQYFLDIFPSFDVFCQVFDECSRNHECLVIDNTITVQNPIDRLFWHKADPSCQKANATRFVDSGARFRAKQRNDRLQPKIMEAYARKTMCPINLQPLLDDPDKDVDEFMSGLIEGL